MGRPVIVDLLLLRYLVREHLALQNEVRDMAKATLFPCAYCTAHIESAGDCTEAGGECKACKKNEECPCSGCHGDSENFMWRGVVEANEPEDREVSDFVALITKELGE